MALIVGTVLVTINHCNCCFMHGTFSKVCLIKSVMTFFVPYAVSTISSVQAIKCKTYRATHQIDSTTT
ncbi:MAG: nitrate/nitrite transporter NrtS [Planctomycetota bacterium]